MTKTREFHYQGNPDGIARRARQREHVLESRKRKEQEDGRKQRKSKGKLRPLTMTEVLAL